MLHYIVQIVLVGRELPWVVGAFQLQQAQSCNDIYFDRWSKQAFSNALFQVAANAADDICCFKIFYYFQASG
ncbi:hypothetical protein MKQ70_27630 [Chitinophaga sedimenti]|uniref:hypothetical protein n=1 Tax=Chitinophaga sedimenti TaxID=2033606 RepID=UPI0020050082|nr:hypothetical protein [Chitinophaga sedimenti]MCK7558562.1 hypothetical protein [Chitinophaga sedimenti]